MESSPLGIITMRYHTLFTYTLTDAEAEADSTVDNHKLNRQVFITILHSLAL